MKNFYSAAKVLGAIAMTAALTGCGGVIDDGNFGVEKGFWGKYNLEAVEGPYLAIFDTVKVIYGREMLLPISDANPKDKNGMMLKDLDLSVSIVAKKGGSPKFWSDRQDLVYDKDKGAYLLGINYIDKDAKSVLTETMRGFSSEDLLDKPSDFENKFKADLQKELDKNYPDTFEVRVVRVSNIKVADKVEEKIQAIAAVEAQQAMNTAQERSIEGRSRIVDQEAQMIRSAANKSGLTVDQVQYNEYLKALRAFADATSPATAANVTVAPKAPK